MGKQDLMGESPAFASGRGGGLHGVGRGAWGRARGGRDCCVRVRTHLASRGMIGRAFSVTDPAAQVPRARALRRPLRVGGQPFPPAPPVAPLPTSCQAAPPRPSRLASLQFF